MSRLMFWVGLMFVVTPLLIVATVILTSRYLRRKRDSATADDHPHGRNA